MKIKNNGKLIISLAEISKKLDGLFGSYKMAQSIEEKSKYYYSIKFILSIEPLESIYSNLKPFNEIDKMYIDNLKNKYHLDEYINRLRSLTEKKEIVENRIYMFAYIKAYKDLNIITEEEANYYYNVADDILRKVNKNESN